MNWRNLEDSEFGLRYSLSFSALFPVKTICYWVFKIFVDYALKLISHSGI